MKRKTTKTSSSRTRQPSPHAKSATRPKRQAAPSPADLLEDIRRNILFTGVRAKTIQTVLRGVEVRLFDAGDVIFDEFTTGRAIYMIVRGRVRIKNYAKYGVESMLAVLRQGDFFGELSIIDNLPRSARAEALTGCTIAVLQGEQFRTLVHESEAFAMNLLKKLSLSLRSMDQTFVAELERNALESHQKMRVAAYCVARALPMRTTCSPAARTSLDNLLASMPRLVISSLAGRGPLRLSSRTSWSWPSSSMVRAMILA